MRRQHEIIFIDDSLGPNGDQFRETLYIGALDDSWKIANQHALQQSSSWSSWLQILVTSLDLRQVSERFRTERTTKSICAKFSKERETRREDDRRQSVDNVGRDHTQLVSNCVNMLL